MILKSTNTIFWKAHCSQWEMKKFYPTLILSKLTQNIYFMLNNLFSDQFNKLEMNALTNDMLHAQNIHELSVHE